MPQEATAVQLPGCGCLKRNCRHERWAWRCFATAHPVEAAERDFPRFMRYVRRVKGFNGTAREMRDLLAEEPPRA